MLNTSGAAAGVDAPGGDVSHLHRERCWSNVRGRSDQSRSAARAAGIAALMRCGHDVYPSSGTGTPAAGHLSGCRAVAAPEPP
jgi:hypothetical protein